MKQKAEMLACKLVIFGLAAGWMFAVCWAASCRGPVWTCIWLALILAAPWPLCRMAETLWQRYVRLHTNQKAPGCYQQPGAKNSESGDPLIAASILQRYKR